MTLLLSKKPWLSTTLKSFNLLFQNKAALITERQFVTNQQYCRITRWPRARPWGLRKPPKKFFIDPFIKKLKWKPLLEWSQAYENDPNSLKFEQGYIQTNEHISVFYFYKSRSCESTVAEKLFEIKGVSVFIS